MSSFQSEDETKGTEVSVSCLSCANTTVHEVLKSIDAKDEFDMGNNIKFNNHTQYQIIQCRGCNTISFRKLENDVDLEELKGETHKYTEILYPSRLPGRKKPIEFRYLPKQIRILYDEIYLCISNQSYISASFGMGILLEQVCRDKDINGKSLEAMIKQLLEKKMITEKSFEILNDIRQIRNNAAHEATHLDSNQIILGLDIIEHLIHDLYVVPYKAKLLK